MRSRGFYLVQSYNKQKHLEATSKRIGATIHQSNEY